MARSSAVGLVVGAPLLVLVLLGAGAAPAHAQSASLTLSPAAALWNDVVEIRIEGTGCSGQTAEPQLSTSGAPRIDIVLLGCVQGSTTPFSTVVHVGPLYPREYLVTVFDASSPLSPLPPLATAELRVYDEASLGIELPAAATDAAPFTLVFTGIASSLCYQFDPPIVEGRVITAHFLDGCPILPPLGPAYFEEPFEIGPLPAGEYEVRFFTNSSVPGIGMLARRSLTVHDADLCVPSDSVLCLHDGRFKVEAAWTDFAGNQGVGHPAPLAEADGSSGLLWFFQADNVELTVKVLNGCGPADEGAWWVFLSSGSTVSYTVTVTDMRTGAKRTYMNAPGVQAPLVADTSAFSCNAP